MGQRRQTAPSLHLDSSAAFLFAVWDLRSVGSEPHRSSRSGPGISTFSTEYSDGAQSSAGILPRDGKHGWPLAS